MSHLIAKLKRSIARALRRDATRGFQYEAPSRPAGVPKVRVGVIGLGTIGTTHAEVLRRHPFFTLAAATGATDSKRTAATALGCRWFDSAAELFAAGEVDAVVIATPHWQHAELSIAALRAGLHVVCEKPLAVTAVDADSILQAQRESGRHLAVVSQSRFDPVFRHVKALLASGEMGPMIRCDMVETFWRSDAYYRSAPWRSTWRGEGGGVLMNQAPHVLDRYLWFCGAPQTVVGVCDTTLHAIEVEDSASVLFRHANGTHGHVHVSTNECPWLSRTVIACDRGRITVENGVIRVAKLQDSIRARTATTDGATDIPCETREIAASGAPLADLLGAFYENFALAVAGRQSLAVSGEDGARVVELANAAGLSSATGRAIALPLDRAAYDAFIARKLGHPSSP